VRDNASVNTAAAAAADQLMMTMMMIRHASLNSSKLSIVITLASPLSL